MKVLKINTAEPAKTGDNLPELPLFKYGLYLMLGLASQLTLGCYPGVIKYLIVVSHMGPIMVLVVPGLINLILVGVYIIAVHDVRSILMVNRPVVIMVILQFNIFTAVYAPQLTLSIFVQLIMLAAPFFTAILSKLIFKTALPRYTIPAIIITVLGAALAVSGNMILNIGEEDYMLTHSDYLGFFLTLVYAVTLAGLMIWTQIQQHKHTTSVLLWVIFLAVIPIPLPVSICIDDWTVLQRMSLSDFGVMAILTFVVWFLATAGQIIAIRKVGSTIVGTLVPSRLVVAYVFGYVVLGEELTYLNMLGSGVVFMTLALYLYYQYYMKNKQRKFAAELPKYDRLQAIMEKQ